MTLAIDDGLRQTRAQIQRHAARAGIVDLIAVSQSGIRCEQHSRTSFWSKSLSLSPKFRLAAAPNVYRT
jgi:hypothetical protein